MNVRYVHNTAGAYVAFVTGGQLFTPDCVWLGAVVAGAEVYDTQGLFIGELRRDDRLVRNLASQLPRQIMRPRPPMQPVRPLPPKRRLFMSALSPSYEDVFQGLRRPLTMLTPLRRLAELEVLDGAAVVADDHAFLGRVTRDAADPDSLAATAGEHGRPHAERSIFNPAGVYGSQASPLSPFHPSTPTPPRIERDGEVLAYLSVNPDVPARVHPDELVAWLKIG